MAKLQVCPSCHSEIPAGHFLCPRCELIVDNSPVERAPEPPREPSLVYRMLSPMDGSLDSPVGPPPLPDHYRDASGQAAGHQADESTVEFTALPPLAGIPLVTGELDPRKHALSSFEAYVVSLLDGISNVERVGEAAGLGPVEIQSVLHSLAVRKVVRIEKAPEAAPQPKAVLGRLQPVKAAFIPGFPSQPPRPVTPLQQAILLEKAGNLKGAIDVLEKAISQSKQPAPLYNRLAVVLVKERRDFATAEALLTKALQLEPRNLIYEENLYKVHELTLARMRKR